MSKSKNFWAFCAVVVAGIAYLVAWLFQYFNWGSSLATAGRIIAAVCGLIAWIIVFILGWKKVRTNNVWMVVVYIVCMAMIVVFAFLPVLL